MKTNDNGTNREMTETEEAQHLAIIAIHGEETKAKEKAEADKAVAKQAVFTKLGLTADEAALLLG
jgi:hypothetical protein